ncbi:universal stress protein [Nitrospira sp. Nam80]
MRGSGTHSCHSVSHTIRYRIGSLGIWQTRCLRRFWCARRLLTSDDAKGVTIKRILAEGVPSVEIARLARLEKVDLVVMGSYGGEVGSVDKIARTVFRRIGRPFIVGCLVIGFCTQGAAQSEQNNRSSGRMKGLFRKS